MTTSQPSGKKNPETKTCPICKKELPLLTKDGKHNFCPHNTGPNVTIDICIKCKVNLPTN